MVLQAIEERFGIIGTIVARLVGPGLEPGHVPRGADPRARGPRRRRRAEALEGPVQEDLGRERDRPVRPRRRRLPAVGARASCSSASASPSAPSVSGRARRRRRRLAARVRGHRVGAERHLPHRAVPLRRERRACRASSPASTSRPRSAAAGDRGNRGGCSGILRATSTAPQAGTRALRPCLTGAA